MKQKYGFVYIWYDRKHKRYYIGCHWGTEDDGYICSSSWMKRAYKIRPQDFKRKILARVYTKRKHLLEEEYKWLSKIKNEELGKKYYNKNNHHFGHWSNNPKSYDKIFNEEYKKKSSERMKGEKNPFYGKKHDDDTKKIIKEKRKQQIITDEHKKSISISHLGEKNHFYGKSHNSETRNNISNKIKELWKTKEYREMMISKRTKKRI